MKRYTKVVGYSPFPYKGAPTYIEPKVWYTEKEYYKRMDSLSGFEFPYTHVAKRDRDGKIIRIKALMIWEHRLEENERK